MTIRWADYDPILVFQPHIVRHAILRLPCLSCVQEPRDHRRCLLLGESSATLLAWEVVQQASYGCTWRQRFAFHRTWRRCQEPECGVQCGERVVGGKAPEVSQSFGNRRYTGRFVIGHMTMLYGQQERILQGFGNSIRGSRKSRHPTFRQTLPLSGADNPEPGLVPLFHC